MGALDFLVLSGVALAPAWLRIVRHGYSGRRTGAPAPGDAADQVLLDGARMLLAVSGLLLLLGAFKIGETGRIGLFLLPLVLLPVCRGLEKFGSPGRVATALAAWGVGQALLMEAFLDTRW
jgi:hypothetical protein